MRIPLYLLKDIATVEAFTGDSAYGPQYTQPVTVRCRIDTPSRQKGLSYSVLGTEDVKILRTGVFPPETVIPEKSKVTFEGRAYVVKDATPQKGLVPSHIEALLEGL